MEVSRELLQKCLDKMTEDFVVIDNEFGGGYGLPELEKQILKGNEEEIRQLREILAKPI